MYYRSVDKVHSTTYVDDVFIANTVGNFSEIALATSNSYAEI